MNLNKFVFIDIQVKNGDEETKYPLHNHEANHAVGNNQVKVT